MKKVLLITNIPTPYRIPLFNELNRQLSELGIQFKVIFGALHYSRRRWSINLSDCGFNYDILSSFKIAFGNSERTLFSYSGVISAFREYHPDVIITSGFSLASMKVWFYTLFRNIPYVIWSGGVLKKGRYDSKLRRTQRKALVKRAAAFIACSSKAKECLISLGAPASQVFMGLDTVDTSYFASQTELIRDNYQANGAHHLTYVGYLNPRKNVMKLLKVLDELRNHRTDFLLDIIGDGEEREKLESYVNEKELSQFVVFHGYVQKEELPQYLATSRCLLFQTDFDIWGLVLVEAMAAGVPCIASIHAGATHDLIESDVTGFAMDFSKTAEVAQKIDWILENAEQADRIGKNASRFVAEKASLSESSLGFVKAIAAS